MISIEYTCADGTPLTVHFEDEAAADRSWRLEREHGRDPQTPLGDALNRLGIAGARRAYDEVDLLLPPSFRPGPDAGGFSYFDTTPMSADEMGTFFAGCGKLVEEHGSALGIWHERCLPGTRQAVAELDAADDRVSLQQLAETQAYAQQLTMIPAYVCGNDLTLLQTAIEPVVGSDAPLVANELAQGFENDTLAADQWLWEVARLARADAEVAAALDDAAPGAVADRMQALRRAGASAAFFDALDAFLAEFGHRAEGWDIACPTWSEQRDGFWAQLHQLSRPDAPEPAQAVVKAAARREALVAELEAKFAALGDDAAVGRFRRRLARIEPYVAVREERARWQVAATGALRRAVLRRGAALVAAGHLDDPVDVLFLLPDELEASALPAANELRTTAASRRAAHEQRCRVPAPLFVGRGAVDTEGNGAGNGWRGVAASRGVATGRARVIVDLVDADRLEPGDILVCVMTSPPWTPLFGLASAVVVETGDLGSHPAIAAREYGIPCVLGCRGITADLADGTLITVDGAAGTVQVGSG
jgi:pyruvate,water dikinase